MKKLKTRNEYVGCNGKARYYVDEKRATSYGYWDFVKVINGKTVFNNYKYSMTTSKHQNHVWWLMKDLGHEIDVTVSISSGLSDETFKEHALYSVYRSLIYLMVQNNTKRIRQKTKEENTIIIKKLKEKTKVLRDMGAEFNFKRVYRLYREFKKRRDIKNKAIDFYKDNKNKIFRDHYKDRYRIIGNRASQGRFILKSMDATKKGGKLREIYWEYAFNNFKLCPLSMALEGN
jgi:hypothetical protein